MSPALWKDVFAALPETAFFEVVRHYLGPVQTPFHKPDLVKRMEAFFQRPDVLESVLSFIDLDDSRILSIIGFLDGVSRRRLEEMLRDMGRLQLQDAIRNLEERMLIWQSEDAERSVFLLTPLGEAVKESGLLGGGCILETEPAETEPVESAAGGAAEGAADTAGRAARTGRLPYCWFNDNFLTMALSFLAEGPSLFRKEGGIRKKALQDMEDLFPALFNDGRGHERILLTGRGLLTSGLVIRKGETLQPVLPAWKQLENYTPEMRLNLLRAHALTGNGIPAEHTIRALRLFAGHLPPGQACSRRSLALLLQLAISPSFLSTRRALLAISHMELMGLLHASPHARNGDFFSINGMQSEAAAGRLVLNASGDITLHPESSFFYNLALTAHPEKLDITASFSQDKTCFHSGLGHDVDPAALKKELEDRTGAHLPQNIRTLFSEWEREFREVECSLCAVLKVEGVRREILEETGLLNPWTKEKLPGGLWLLQPEHETAWKAALAEAGIDGLPPLPALAVNSSSKVHAAASKPLLQLPRIPEDTPLPLSRGSWRPCVPAPSPELTEKLKTQGKKIFKTPGELESFNERLERRLILVPEQIRRGAWRYEVLSAKGLDYRGKLRLIEAAMSGTTDRLALNIPEGNTLRTILLLPLKMEKDGQDYLLSGLKLPEEKEVCYKVRKIGMLRRIKTSIF